MTNEQSKPPFSPELTQILGDLHMRLSDVEKSLIPPAVVQGQAEAAERRRRTQEYIERDQKGMEAYAQIVMVIGYGALFTLWIQLKDSMPAWYYFFTGLLALISASLYVLFEVIKIGLASYANTKWTDDADTDEWWAQRMRFDMLERRMWKYFYFPTAICGVGAAAMLAIRLLWNCLKSALAYV
jgi:hypothetical protein